MQHLRVHGQGARGFSTYEVQSVIKYGVMISGYFNLGVFHHFEDLVRLAKIVQIRYTYAVF